MNHSTVLRPMKISNIDVDAALANVRQQLQADTTVAPSMRTAIELLIVLVQILSGRINTHSANSSKPPSQDPNRPRQNRLKSGRKPGGQVVDLDIRRYVTEYQAEILENAQGHRFVAPFPVGVERSVQ